MPPSKAGAESKLPRSCRQMTKWTAQRQADPTWNRSRIRDAALNLEIVWSSQAFNIPKFQNFRRPCLPFGQGWRRASPTPSQPRQQKNLRPRRELLPPRIPINHPVDRHRDPLLDPRLKPGILFSQFPEQLPDVLDLAAAAGELAGRAPEGDFRGGVIEVMVSDKNPVSRLSGIH